MLGLKIPQQAEKEIEKPTTFPGFGKETLQNKKLINLKKTDTMEQNRVIEEITLPLDYSLVLKLYLEWVIQA